MISRIVYDAMIWFLSVYGTAVVALVVWAVAVIRLGTWRQWHHSYIGLGLLMLPWAFAYTRLEVLTTPVTLVGLLILVDDAYQHARQCFQPSYESPLHRAYVWVVRSLSR